MSANQLALTSYLHKAGAKCVHMRETEKYQEIGGTFK